MNKLLYLLLLFVVGLSCTRNSEIEKYQTKRDNIVNVHEKVKEIETGDVLIGSIAPIRMIDNYLLILDVKSLDKLIRIFDKNHFNYVTSVAHKGQGPGEIVNIAELATNEVDGKFYVTDLGKLNIFSYDLDSVLADPDKYMPGVKAKIGQKVFPDRYQYINDTFSIGRVIEVGKTDFSQTSAKWNMISGEITPMKYSNPDINKKRITLATSIEHGVYVEAYNYHDLITVCSLDGELKYNIYGPNWDKNRTKNYYHNQAIFCNNKIITGYSGDEEYLYTYFLVFDINGNYLKTLDVGYKIYDFCFDKKNNRIILSMDDVIQFGYLDLDGLI